MLRPVAPSGFAHPMITSSMSPGSSRARSIACFSACPPIVAPWVMLNEPRQLLLTLAQFAPLRSADPRECNELLPNILRDHPGYVNLLVANASDRSVFCAARPLDPNVPRHRNLWFDRLLETRRTTIGDYQLSA